MRTACQALVVRYAPDPSAGEVLNIGVVLLAPAAGFCGARFVDSWKRITGAFPEVDLVHLRRTASAIERACAATDGAQLSLLPRNDIVATFEAIVPPDDASLSHSAPITGLTSDPQKTLEELFQRYVGSRGRPVVQNSRPDSSVWRSVETALRARGLFGKVSSKILTTKHYEEEFPAAWKNGQWNVAAPVSLDLLDPASIVRKAINWTGRIVVLEPDKQATDVHLVVGLPDAHASRLVREASANALGILHDDLEARGLASVVLESDAAGLAEKIEDDLLHQADE